MTIRIGGFRFDITKSEGIGWHFNNANDVDNGIAVSVYETKDRKGFLRVLGAKNTAFRSVEKDGSPTIGIWCYLLTEEELNEFKATSHKNWGALALKVDIRARTSKEPKNWMREV